MKNFALFLVAFLAAAYIFGSEEISVHRNESAISESPAFASAKFVELLKTGGKKLSSYRVRYVFQVGGAQYYALTTSTDENGALRSRRAFRSHSSTSLAAAELAVRLAQT